ncbi:MAG TPA: ABC transporter permease [Kofleriaceae bacterium]|nr:ABC transporter permease [Kofleriaceae bacterium]
MTGASAARALRRHAVPLLIPLLSFTLFLIAWTLVARSIETRYGTLPTPAQVWHQAGVLVDEHFAARRKEDQFHGHQRERAAELERAAAVLRARVADGRGDAQTLADADLLEQRAGETRAQPYAGSPTFFDQIATSLKTVFLGFLVASLIAIPLGVLCGLSRTFAAAVNPFVQLFKPVSPLAWLPIVMIVVGALYTTPPEEAWFDKSFLSSALTVALCSLWPTLMNTALGVSSVPREYHAVAQVLGLSWWTRVRRIVVPAALPLIFAGLRISLGVGWMVLIAAEMLSQNPGLGKFIWDMFQNGSSQTLAQIMVAVFTIGAIGFALDRCMVLLQRLVTHRGEAAAWR